MTLSEALQVLQIAATLTSASLSEEQKGYGTNTEDAFDEAIRITLDRLAQFEISTGDAPNP